MVPKAASSRFLRKMIILFLKPCLHGENVGKITQRKIANSLIIRLLAIFLVPGAVLGESNLIQSPPTGTDRYLFEIQCFTSCFNRKQFNVVVTF